MLSMTEDITDQTQNLLCLILHKMWQPSIILYSRSTGVWYDAQYWQQVTHYHSVWWQLYDCDPFTTGSNVNTQQGLGFIHFTEPYCIQLLAVSLAAPRKAYFTAPRLVSGPQSRRPLAAAKLVYWLVGLSVSKNYKLIFMGFDSDMQTNE